MALFQKRFMMEFYFRPKIIAAWLTRLLARPGNIPRFLKAGLGFLLYITERKGKE